MLSAGTSHWVFSYFLSRRQRVQSGPRIVTSEEPVVTLAFLEKGMFCYFYGYEVSFFVLLYCGHRVALFEYPLYPEKVVYV